MMNRKLSVLIVCVFLFPLLLLWPAAAQTEELEMVNHPVNTSGLTGLLMTSSPYTLPPRTVEIAASILSENSITPDYTITEYPISVSFGLSENSEVAIKSSYITVSEGPTGTTFITRKTGDLELSYKWNFNQQSETSVRPALAIFVTGVIPADKADKNDDSKTNSVSHMGIRLGLSAGTEINWKNYVLGIYADGQIAGQDLLDKQSKDTYGIVNAGLLLPISKYQNLQMLFEYSLVSQKSVVNLNGGDYTAWTYGLRLVTERFNWTFGTQFIHKKAPGYDNSGRLMGVMSLKF